MPPTQDSIANKVSQVNPDLTGTDDPIVSSAPPYDTRVPLFRQQYPEYNTVNDDELMKKMIGFKATLKNKITKANEELSKIKYEFKV